MGVWFREPMIMGKFGTVFWEIGDDYLIWSVFPDSPDNGDNWNAPVTTDSTDGNLGTKNGTRWRIQILQWV